jgi:hypothetical protein
MSCAGPKSGAGGKYLSHSLTRVAKEKSKDALRENPAYKHIKMKPKAKKDKMLPKGTGSAQSIEMQDMGKE